MKEIKTKYRLAGSLLAFAILASASPVTSHAETYESNGRLMTTDWSKEIRQSQEEQSGNWPLSAKNRLVRVSSADPVKTPDINYVGTYTNAEGREVVRLNFNMQVASANQWDKLLLKLPSNLDKKVDHNHPFRGIYKGTTSYGTHDVADMDNLSKDISEAKAVPDRLDWSVGGGENVYAFDLYQNGSMKPGSQVLPIDLVLKEGETIKDIKDDLLVQARLTDKNYERVYARSGERTADYMQYTMTTVIGNNKNYALSLNQDLSSQPPSNPGFTYNKFYSTVSSVKFNQEKGYLEVYHRQSKWATGSGYALRQAVDSKFYDLLDERNGMAGEVYLMGADAELYPGFGSNYEPNNNSKIQFAKSDINRDLGGGIGFLQVAGSDWDTTKEYEGGIKTKKSSNVKSTDAILGTAASTSNGGVYTVVRYFIKPDELDKLIKENGLESFTFRTSILRENETSYQGNTVKGTSVYDFSSAKERNLKRGDKVELSFDKAQYNSRNGTTVTKPQITIGDDKHNISFKDSISYDSTGLKATWTVPFDIKIKKGEKIRVKSVDWKENDRASELVIDFGENDKIKANSEVDYSPIEMQRSASLTGGALVSTIEKPNVDEIFTDSDSIRGHSFHEGAEIGISYKDPDTNELISQKLSAIALKKADDDFDYSTIMTAAKKVNEKNHMAFPFDTENVNQGGYVQEGKTYEDFKMPRLIKDMPIRVSNLASLSSFIPSDEVVEKVQAKVHFDLNGGSLSTNIKSFEGYDRDIDSEDFYVTEREKEEDEIVRIVPMNEKYFGEEGYLPNGFEGENISNLDHDGKTLKGDSLELRKFIGEEPKKEGLEFLGWTTKELKGSPEEVQKVFHKLSQDKKIARSPEDLEAEDTFIFTKNSPVAKTTRVYAAYGVKKAQGLDPRQTYDEENDRQYVEIVPEEGKSLPENAIFRLVKKSGDSYEALDLETTDISGKKVFDITDLGEGDFDKNADYYIETKEEGKPASYSKNPIKIDKTPPSFLGEEGEEIALIQDPYGYEVKVSSSATDNSGILRFYPVDDKKAGYYDKASSQSQVDLEQKTEIQAGKLRTFSFEVVDKYGNKAKAEKQVSPKAEPVNIMVERPRRDQDFIIVHSEEGVSLNIKVIGKDGKSIYEVNHRMSSASEQISLEENGEPFILERGQKIQIEASLEGKETNKVNTRVR